MSISRAGKLNRIFLVYALISITALVFCASAEPVSAAEGYEDVASSSQIKSSRPVSKYGMVPVYAKDVKDGTYQAEMRTSSTFFRVAETKLTVKKNRMTAVLLIGSNSYKCVYPGTAEKAAKAPLKEYIMAEETDLGTTFEIPVEALNKEIDLAAFSRRKKKWYDRKVLSDAASRPESALSFKLPDYDRIESAIDLYDEKNGTDTRKEYAGSEDAEEEPSEEETGAPEAAAVDMKDGTYSVEVILTGGSGRASVSSPTWLIVKDGKAYARLLWSSAYYDYMVVGGKKYLNESEEGGNSTFTIPVTQFDSPMAVIADTTAMGDPVAIDYRLTFYKDSIAGKNKIPQEAAKGVIIFAVIIAVVGGILNYVLKKRAER